MKKIIAILAILLLLTGSLSVEGFAKPAYCYNALRMCAAECTGTYGDFGLMAGGCLMGCSIGYLACG